MSIAIRTLYFELFKAIFGLPDYIFEQFKHLVVHVPLYLQTLKFRHIYSHILIKLEVVSEIHGDLRDTCYRHL
jgi:hypothetical protein